MKKPNLRFKLLIHPQFQVTLIAINVVTVFLAFGFVAIQVSRTFEKLAEMGRESGLAEGHAYYRFLALQASTLHSYLLIALIFAWAVSLVVTLFLSHRLAGPIERLKSFFEGIARGDEVRTLGFRKNDFFTDLPPVINRALEKIRE